MRRIKPQLGKPGWMLVIGVLFLRVVLPMNVVHFDAASASRGSVMAGAELGALTNTGYVQVMDQLATSASLPDVMFATFQNLPLNVPLYSLNGGLTWQTVQTRPWLSNPRIAVVPRTEPGASVRLLAAAGNTVYRSGDYGQTWAQANLPPTSNNCEAYSVPDLVVSPADPTRLYLTQACQWFEPDPFGGAWVIIHDVYASIDRGVSWSVLKHHAHTPVPSPSIANRIYVRDTSDQWWQSDDGGATWSPRNFPVSLLALDAQNPDRLYGLIGNVGMGSSDGGINWTEWAAQPPCSSSDLLQLLAHPSTTEVLFLRCYSGVYRSRNGGAGWEQIVPWSGYLLAADYGNPQRLLWARADGLWASVDEGASWTHRTYDYLSRQAIAWRPHLKSSALISVSEFSSHYAVAALSAANAWAAGGWYGTILHWDGSTWTPVPNPTNIDNIYEIDMISTNEGWAVGGCCGDLFTTEGGILYWNGAVWTKSISTTVPLYSLAMVSAADGWAMGGNGAVFRWNGNGWLQFASPITETMNSIAMVSADEGWAVGQNGAIARWDGNTWASFPSPTTATLSSVDLVSADEGWAVGSFGTILRWNGSAWATFTSPPVMHLSSVDMVSASDGWAVGTDSSGDDSAILHWDGSAWTRITSPTNRSLLAIAMVSAERGWIVGAYGVMLEKVSNRFLPSISR